MYMWFVVYNILQRRLNNEDNLHIRMYITIWPKISHLRMCQVRTIFMLKMLHPLPAYFWYEGIYHMINHIDFDTNHV